MPSTLRARVALFALLGVFLIPVVISSLRGLTHVLTCRDPVETPFSLRIVPGAEPVLVSSQLLRRDEPRLLCGGLAVDMRARAVDGRVAMEVPITNHSPHPWHGTVLMRLGATSLPVDVGEVPPGGMGTDEVVFDLAPGLHEVGGSLLIGP